MDEHPQISQVSCSMSCWDEIYAVMGLVQLVKRPAQSSESPRLEKCRQHPLRSGIGKNVNVNDSWMEEENRLDEHLQSSSVFCSRIDGCHVYHALLKTKFEVYKEDDKNHEKKENEH
ncbi:hypothetical protein PMAYCL1PPCAC_17426, partial [Pristionchus mayeri]